MKKMVIVVIALSFFSVACSHHKHKHHDHKAHYKKHWKMMDTNKDEVITKDEFNKAHAEMFKKMDANGDGKVTKKEKKEHMQSKKRSCNH